MWNNSLGLRRYHPAEDHIHLRSVSKPCDLLQCGPRCTCSLQHPSLSMFLTDVIQGCIQGDLGFYPRVVFEFGMHLPSRRMATSKVTLDETQDYIFVEHALWHRTIMLMFCFERLFLRLGPISWWNPFDDVELYQYGLICFHVGPWYTKKSAWTY